MAERNASDILNLRLPLYAYTAPLWQGRRVLEIGCEEGDSAAYLASHGASQVVVIDTDVARIERARAEFPHPNVDYRPAADLRQMAAPHEAFDLVVIPEGKSLVANRNLLTVLRRVLTPSGHLLVSVPAADRRTPAFSEGLGYYELVDALEAQFKVVRMLGRTPFLGFGLVEFDGSADALRLDATLLRGATEAPSHYVAIAGATAPPPLGYALVQVPFAPLEARLTQAPEPTRAGESEETARRLAAERTQQATEIAQLRRQLEEARLAGRGAPGAGGLKVAIGTPGAGGVDPALARAELAERRLDEVERRGRTRLDEADLRLTELRRKLDDALVQSESAVRIARVQGDEIEELRGRLRRAAEDRAATDLELAKLRRALAEADESVLTLTRKTAEEMTAVAQRISVGLRAPSNDPGGPRERHAEVGALREEIEHLRAQLAAAPTPTLSRGGELAHAGLSGAPGGDAEARVREAEAAAARARAEVAALAERLRAAEAHVRALEPRAAALPERDERIARLDGERQQLVERARALEAALRSRREAEESRPGAPPLPAAAAELQRIASRAHAAEVHRLQASLEEQAAQVVELEDALRLVEGRATAAEKDAAALRRNAKALEDADRARRGRLAELEGKLLRLEREKSTGGAGAGDGARAGALELEEARQRLAAMEQRALAAEQRAVGLDEQRRAAEGRAAAADLRARATEETPRVDAERAAPVMSPAQNGAHAAPATREVQAAIEEIEEQLRHEVRMLAAIEETLARARDELTQARGGGGAPPAELEQALAAKDAQLVEGRLELARLRREAEARQSHLEREVSELRTRLDPLGQYGEDQSQSTQLIVMHTTLANIRRRAARLRDELEGFRRRLDSIPAGALSSLLEEIGEDLSEFAK